MLLPKFPFVGTNGRWLLLEMREWAEERKIKEGGMGLATRA